MSGSDGDISFDMDMDASQIISALEDIQSTAAEVMEAIKESTEKAGESIDENLGESSSKAKEKVHELNEETMNLGKSLDEIKEKIGVAFEATGVTALYEAAEKVVDELAEIAEKASAIKSLSEAMEITTSQTQALEHAALLNDASMNMVTRTINRLSMELVRARDGSGEAAKVLIELGIATDKIYDPAYSGYDAFVALGKGLRNASTEAAVHEHIISSLGRNMGAVIPTIKEFNGTQEGVAAANQKANAMTKEQIAALEEWNRQWKGLKESIGGAISSIVADYAILQKASEGSFSNASTAEKLADGFKEEANAAKSYSLDVIKANQQADAFIAEKQAKKKEEQLEEMNEDQRQLQFFKEGTEQRMEASRALAEATLAYYGTGTKIATDKVKEANQEALKDALDYVEKYNEAQKKLSDSAAEAQEKIATANQNTALKILSAEDARHEISPETYAEAQISADTAIEQAEIKLYQTKINNLHNDGVNNAENAVQRMQINSSILAAEETLSDKVIEIRQKETDELKKQLVEREQAQLAAAKRTEDIAMGQADAALKILASQQKSGKDPSSIAAAQSIVIEEQLAAQTAYNASVIAMYNEQLKAGKLDLDEYKKAVQDTTNTQIQENQKAAIQIEQFHQQAADKVKQDWQAVTNPIVSGLDNAFRDMLEKGTSFTQSMRKLFMTLSEDLITGAFNKMVSSWVTGEATKLASSQSAATILNALHLQNLVLSKTTDTTQAIADIQTKAAQAAAGAFAATAGIPLIGPALAPAAAAEADASVMAFTAQIGAYEGGGLVNNDQLALLHANEMVLPQDIRKGIEAKLLNQGNGSVDDRGGNANHFSISAMDSKSFEKFLSKQGNRNTVANMVNKANQRGNRNVRARV